MTELSVFDQGPPEPCPTSFNLAHYVLAQGAEFPDKIALAVLSLSGAERWSFAKLRQAVYGAGTGLLDQGLQPGDRVLMRIGNSVAFPISYLGAILVGLIPVPTSALLTEPEVTQIAEEVAPKLIIAEHGVTLPRQDLPQTSADALLAMSSLPAAEPDLGSPNRPAYIVYTSGTSGTPRAVTHAHRAIWARRMMFDGWYGLAAQDRMLHAGAFNWTFTLGTGLLDPWTVGATALILAKSVTPGELPLLLKRHDATIFAGAPGVYRQMLRSPVPPLPKLRHGLSAGEKLPETTRTRWEAATGTAVHEAFGMSECSTFVSGSPTRPAGPGSLGAPQGGRRVAVLEDGAPVPLGTSGVLGVSTRDPGLMLGYWDRALGGPNLVRGDWFETGDRMVMSEGGALSYEGRADDMINAGGIRVSPLEIERALSEHPQIQACAAVEARVSEDTSIIAAYYEAEDDLPPDDLAAFTAERLARYKCPRAFVRLSDLPRSANGKISRKALRRRDLPPA